MAGQAKTTAMVVVILMVGVSVRAAEVPVDVESRTAASRAAAQEYAQVLLGELQAAMAAGGPVAAIEVCHVRAPEIARAQSRADGWTVGRTSLRPRNPANRPDAWEQAQLVQFEARRAAGEDPARIEVTEVVTTGPEPVFRYMKAIPTGEPCLACHGRSLAADVDARLADLYPDDRARGFALGDLRGAFSISQPLP